MSVLVNRKALLCKNSCRRGVPCASITGELSHYMQASYDVILALMTMGCMGIHFSVWVGHGTINFSTVVDYSFITSSYHAEHVPIK